MPYLESSAAPSFRRGSSSLVARYAALATACVLLLIADLRFQYLEVVRQWVTVLTHPLQVVAAAPVDFLRNATIYSATLVETQLENADLRRQQLDASQRLLRLEHTERENAELRRLLNMSHAINTRSLAADILYDAPDAFARKVILDRGARHGVLAGSAVVDADGMIGQVSRVYPVQAEVTLLSDRDLEVPVQLPRSGLRGVLVGNGRAPLELRFILEGADVQPGDLIHTSGLDGIFLPGLPVAQVLQVTPGNDGFLAIQAAAVGKVERATQVLVLGRDALPLPSPDPATALGFPPDPALTLDEGDEGEEAGVANANGGQR